jgi:hypothetical protein
MTKEEAERLDKLWTDTTPSLTAGEGGPFTRRRELLGLLDPVASNYVRTVAQSTHQSPAQVIGVWAREKIAAAL